jgi:predicted nucleic acid-binding Zn ribbon protein
MHVYLDIYVYKCVHVCKHIDIIVYAYVCSKYVYKYTIMNNFVISLLMNFFAGLI